MEELIWNKLCNDVNQVPPCLNIQEIESMYGCDTQQAGLDMVHAMRLREKLQSMGMQQRNENWREVKGKGNTGRKKTCFYHRVAEEGGGVTKGKTERKKTPKSKAPLTVKQVLIQDDVAEKAGLMTDPANMTYKTPNSQEQHNTTDGRWLDNATKYSEGKHDDTEEEVPTAEG